MSESMRGGMCWLTGLLFTGLLCVSSRSAAAIDQPVRIELDNGRVTVGVRMDSGAAIDRVAPSGSQIKIVDSFDRGRLIQQSYYGSDDGSLWNDKPWRWNPVQGGDWRGGGSEVRDWLKQASRLTTVTQPTHWASGAAVSDAQMTQSIQLDGDLVRVSYGFHYWGTTSHPLLDQEIPAVFVAPQYPTLVTYDGANPWESEATTRRTPGWPNETGKMTENWVAYVNDQDFGLGVYVPAASEFTCYRYKEADEPSACAYVAPLARFAIVPDFQWHYDLTLTLGSLDEIRNRFASEAKRTATIESVAASTTSDEAEATSLQTSTTAPPLTLSDYLATDFDAAVTRVIVEEEVVRIQGVSPVVAGRSLVEWPLSLSVEQAATGDAKVFRTVEPLQLNEFGRFEVICKRFVKDAAGVQRDRAFAKWGVTQSVGDLHFPVSHAHGVDQIVSRDVPSWPLIRGRKGLGALGLDRPLQDLDDLGVSAVTVNILLDTVIHSEPGEGREAFEFDGRTWYANQAALHGLDQTLLEASQRNLLVSAIILVRQRSQCADPEWGRLATCPTADPAGIFVMPNVESLEGINAYGAALDLLAERYSRESNEFGRIHHWIMHNEVNSGWVWTNAGDQTSLDFTQLLYRSLRLADTVIRRYDPASKVFVSLDHHWTTRHDAHCFGSREILEHLLALCTAEGDFDWAIAHHPYPQDLGDPRVWRDTQVSFNFETPKITFRNLEVLDAWVQQPRARFNQSRIRTVHLTEQGLNSRSYEPEELRLQAAGMAYAWQKLSRLDSIEMFHYHNWVDNRHEGGLKIGLRRFPDDETMPLGMKPIWEVFQAMESDRELEAIEFARELIGVQDWSEIMTEVQPMNSDSNATDEH